MTPRESWQVTLDQALKSEIPGIVTGWLSADEYRPFLVSTDTAVSKPRIESIFGEGWAVILQEERMPEDLVTPEEVGGFILKRARELASLRESRPELAFRFAVGWAHTLDDGTPIEGGTNCLMFRPDMAKLKAACALCAVIAREHAGVSVEFGSSLFEIERGTTAEDIEEKCVALDKIEEESELPSDLAKVVARLRAALAVFEAWESDQAAGAPMSVQSCWSEADVFSLVYRVEDGGEVELTL